MMFRNGFETVKRYWRKVSTNELKERSRRHEEFGWRFFIIGMLAMYIFNLPKLKEMSKCAIAVLSASMIVCIIFFAMSFVEHIVLKNRDGSGSKLINFFEKMDRFLKKDKEQFSSDELWKQYSFGFSIEQICLIISSVILALLMLISTRIYFASIDKFITICVIISLISCILAGCCIRRTNQIKDELEKRK